MGILSMMEQRATLKDIGGFKNLEAWLINGAVGGNSSTGILVDEDTALGSSAIWAAVRIISETVASVPLNLYKRRDGTGRDIDRDNPTHGILHTSPNPELTAMEFREMQMANLLLSGNSYAEIIRNNGGAVSELWPLWPDQVTIIRRGGQKLYEITIPGQEKKEYLKPDRVLHVRGFSRGGLTGLDVVATTVESVGVSLALEKYFGKFFSNAANPSGVLEHPGRMSEDAQTRFKAAWESAHTGLDNAHRTAILEEGMQWKQKGVSPEQAQAIEGRKFQVSEVARIFNIPPHLLRDLERATFSNIEQQSIEFGTYTIRPWCVRLEQRYDKQLLSDSERTNYYTKHVLEGLLRGDIKSRFEAYSIARNGGWMSADDIRELEDQNPIEGGDVYLIQGAMIPLGDAGKTPDPPPFAPEPASEPPPEPAPAREGRTEQRTIDDRLLHRKAYAGIFEEIAARMVTQEVNAAQRAVKKAFGGRDATSLRKWIDEFYEKFGGKVGAAFLRSLLSYAELMQGAAALDVDGVVGMTDELRKFTEEYSETLGQRWAISSSKQLKALLRDTAPEELEAVLLERLDGWSLTRAPKVGRREAAQAANALVRATWIDMGVTKFRSKSVGDSCPWCKALDGKVVGISEPMVPANELPAEWVGISFKCDHQHDVEDRIVLYGQDDTGEWVPIKEDKPPQPPINHQPRFHPPYHAGCDCLLLAA